MATNQTTTNIERLVAAGVLDPKGLSEEHIHVINTQMTEGEIDALINVKRKLGGGPPWDPKSKRGYVAAL
jgi:hypothetical protein